MAHDRISNLPEQVLHYLLSFLPLKDAARTSILSKRFSSLWDTLPYLNFGDDFLHPFFASPKQRLNCRQMKKNKILLDIADRIIQRRSQQNAGIVKLCLSIPVLKLSKRQNLRQSPLYFKLERWMSCVARSSLRELDLSNALESIHSLPPSILSAKSLSVLSLHAFSLRSLSSLDIKFPSLRKLRLSKVDLDDSIMVNLIIGSPLLEDLQLISCNGLKTLYVTGLLKLKLLAVCNMSMKIFDIDAPELQVLRVVNNSFEYEFNGKTSARLRELVLGKKFMTEKWLHDFVSQFPFLEKLILLIIGFNRYIKISSGTLKTLQLLTFGNLVEVEIIAPTLENFTFQVGNLPTFVLNASDVLEVGLQLPAWRDDDLGHYELTNFLGCFNNLKTVTLYNIENNDNIIPKDRRDNLLSPLYGTRNLVFFVKDMKTPHTTAVELMEYMLWLSPRAESLSIRNYTHEILAFIKLTYDQKNDQKVLRKSFPCCKLLPIECWRHSLAEVRLEKFEGDEKEMTKIKNYFFEHVKNLKIVDTFSRSDSSFCDGLYSFYDELFPDKDD